MVDLKINPPKINLDDLIKFSHLEILDYLIKRSAEDAGKLDELDIEKFADIISEHYKNLFREDFISRYNKILDDYSNMINQ